MIYFLQLSGVGVYRWDDWAMRFQDSLSSVVGFQWTRQTGNTTMKHRSYHFHVGKVAAKIMKLLDSTRWWWYAYYRNKDLWYRGAAGGSEVGGRHLVPFDLHILVTQRAPQRRCLSPFHDVYFISLLLRQDSLLPKEWKKNDSILNSTHVAQIFNIPTSFSYEVIHILYKCIYTFITSFHFIIRWVKSCINTW